MTLTSSQVRLRGGRGAHQERDLDSSEMQPTRQSLPAANFYDMTFGSSNAVDHYDLIGGGRSD